jgi:hypothetical protein
MPGNPRGHHIVSTFKELHTMSSTAGVLFLVSTFDSAYTPRTDLLGGRTRYRSSREEIRAAGARQENARMSYCT